MVASQRSERQDEQEPSAKSLSRMNAQTELSRIKDGIASLAFEDSPARDLYRNQLIAVAQAALGSAADAYVKQIERINWYPIIFTMGQKDVQRDMAIWKKAQASTIAVLDSVAYHLSTVTPADLTAPLRSGDSNKVFIVHGHDDLMPHEIKAYALKLDLEPIIIADEASAGMTIIEKLERYSDVPFAIVILSADDIGRSFAESSESEKRRARQNAVLELGYFMAKLGRDNVCVIVHADLDSQTDYPSDMEGVVKIKYRKNGDWQTRLIREFRAAAVPFNYKNA
jgi:predicted nucleotide-binding protein